MTIPELTQAAMVSMTGIWKYTFILPGALLNFSQVYQMLYIVIHYTIALLCKTHCYLPCI